jgi:hypothetical protein
MTHPQLVKGPIQCWCETLFEIWPDHQVERAVLRPNR